MVAETAALAVGLLSLAAERELLVPGVILRHETGETPHVPLARPRRTTDQCPIPTLRADVHALRSQILRDRRTDRCNPTCSATTLILPMR